MVVKVVVTMIASTGMPGNSVEIDQRYEEYIVVVGMSSITSRFRILSMPSCAVPSARTNRNANDPKIPATSLSTVPAMAWAPHTRTYRERERD